MDEATVGVYAEHFNSGGTTLFDTSLIGVYLDEGTTRTTVRKSVFRNQSWAPVSGHKGIGNASYANDTSGLRPGAVSLSHEHLFVYCRCGT